jgi:predicted phage tail protein
LLVQAVGGGGKGGGGGAARTPTTERDGLDSRQYAELIDLISEGEIAGLKDGLKSIYLDNTPLQNPNGTFNFQNVTVYTREGTQNQTLIPFANEIKDERSVNVTVRNDGPVTRTITDSQTDAVRITITVPRLEQITNEGDTVGQSFRLQIQIQYNGGGFTTVIDDTVSGRTGDPYQKAYLVNLTGAFPVDVRMVRITGDSNDLRLSNEFTWTSYTEIIYSRLAYPNSALVGIRIDAEQFNSIPQRSYLIRGIKVRIPNNATVDQATGALVYTGIWNGTFGAAQWCSDPAWILWDLLTSTRYGFGRAYTY